MKTSIKEELYFLCLQQIEQRIATTQMAIDSAKESANDDTKSSAGDKHETGRAMAQLEQEKSAVQLHEALALKKTLEKIDYTLSSKSVMVGSVVYTDKGNFFISIPVGKLSVQTEVFYSISIGSPIGDKIKNLQKNDTFEMNGIVYKILGIL